MITEAYFYCRGQESAGIVTSEGRHATTYQCHKGQGLVTQIFSEQHLQKLTGKLISVESRYFY